MTQSSARMMPVLSGDMAVRRRRRSTPAGRRRRLVLCGAALLMVVSVAANFGPLAHYKAARARLDKATAAVNALEVQKGQLQSQVAKLSEAGYLETLAREQLAYVRTGEDLYIVTGAAGGEPATGAGSAAAIGSAGVAGPAAGAGEGASTGATSSASGANTSTPTTSAGESPTAGTGSPGLLERIVTAIRNLF